MKKTLIINIGNTIIHIEEDAYELLTAYLNEIKGYFTKNADDFEIVKDIENRIAEMFTERLQQDQKQVIEMEDVKAVVQQMGRVQDFETNEEENSGGSEEQFYHGPKKLFRDPDMSVVAGVCAGLGHYLNIEARWIRLVFFLLIFVMGTGILAYILLWIAMPKADTRSEKMEMRGEATNLYGYQRSFEEEMASFKASANAQFQPFMQSSGNAIGRMMASLGEVFGKSVQLLVKIIAIGMIAMGFVLMLSLIVGMAAALGFWDANTYQTFPLSIFADHHREQIVLSAFVVFFIPVLALVLFAMRVAFKKVNVHSSVYFALLVIWLLGVFSSGFYVAKITGDFKERAELVQHADLKTYPTYVLDMDRSMSFSKSDSADLHIDDLGNRTVVDNYEDTPFRIPRNIRIEIAKSEQGKSSLSQTFESQGRNFETALRNARNIEYNYTQQDSLLTFNSRLYLKQESSWRNQEVRILLQVPVGTRLRINYRMYRYLQFYNLSCDHQEYGYGDATQYGDWIMTTEGLKCAQDLQTKEESPANP